MTNLAFPTAVQPRSFDEHEVWRDINYLLEQYSLRVIAFEEALKEADINRQLEEQDRLIDFSDDPAIDFSLEEAWPAPGTEQAIQLSEEFRQQALALELFEEDSLEILDFYRIACTLNPHDPETIKGAAHHFRFLGEYDRTVKKLVHLAVLAKQNKDIELAQFVLSGRLIDEELLGMKGPRGANDNGYRVS